LLAIEIYCPVFAISKANYS